MNEKINALFYAKELLVADFVAFDNFLSAATRQQIDAANTKLVALSPLVESIVQ